MQGEAHGSFGESKSSGFFVQFFVFEIFFVFYFKKSIKKIKRLV